ncbi:MAG: hypothetical protein JWM28_3429 [Chitinophagaceae bacterium]|nr:hypothetical protein [Chitinophagaceae bacterium]
MLISQLTTLRCVERLSVHFRVFASGTNSMSKEDFAMFIVESPFYI